MKVVAEHWDQEIKPQSKWYEIDFGGVWRYRDLLLLLVRRDFVSVYKQTILGPLWMIIQPILTTLTFIVIFSRIAGITTDGLPPVLFYLSGITFWTYFADCLTKTSNTFLANAAIFGKVYFPRLVVPASILVSNLFKFGIQLVLFLSVWLWYFFTGDQVRPHFEYLFLFPFLMIILAGLSSAIGILISSLTTKYRDLSFLLSFGVQLLMYATPIVYPLSIVSEKYRWLILANPLTSVLEAFKYIFLGTGVFNWMHLAYSAGVMTALLILALIIFNKVEKSFMDTV